MGNVSVIDKKLSKMLAPTQGAFEFLLLQGLSDENVDVVVYQQLASALERAVFVLSDLALGLNSVETWVEANTVAARHALDCG